MARPREGERRQSAAAIAHGRFMNHFLGRTAQCCDIPPKEKATTKAQPAAQLCVAARASKPQDGRSQVSGDARHRLRSDAHSAVAHRRTASQENACLVRNDVTGPGPALLSKRSREVLPRLGENAGSSTRSPTTTVFHEVLADYDAWCLGYHRKRDLIKSYRRRPSTTGSEAPPHRTDGQSVLAGVAEVRVVDPLTGTTSECDLTGDATKMIASASRPRPGAEAARLRRVPGRCPAFMDGALATHLPWSGLQAA